MKILDFAQQEEESFPQKSLTSEKNYSIKSEKEEIMRESQLTEKAASYRSYLSVVSFLFKTSQSVCICATLVRSMETSLLLLLLKKIMRSNKVFFEQCQLRAQRS